MSSNAETPRSRSRLTKALVATGVGVALLAGGGGTFAAWSDEAPIASAKTIVAGQLDIVNVGNGVWTDSAGNVLTDAYRIAPGAKITYTTDVDIALEGDGLSANFSVAPPPISGTPTDSSALSTTVSVKDANDANLASNDNGAATVELTKGGTYTVEMVVALSHSADNSWQRAVLELRNSTLEIDQVVPDATA
ncbi:alternate-type signal peptide domain-containing protein [Georgenia daeguensis]|uniref:Alternate-type signal peptide domain-containing protein n=1 Tax=Georgenia daeguensis TaxID=908355 RepID=A0ABP8ESZ4_9MICO